MSRQCSNIGTGVTTPLSHQHCKTCTICAGVVGHRADSIKTSLISHKNEHRNPHYLVTDQRLVMVSQWVNDFITAVRKGFYFVTYMEVRNNLPLSMLV